MKTTLSILISFILVVWAQFSHAQVEAYGTEVLLDKMRLNNGISANEAVTYADVTGNPYMFPDYATGELILKSGEKFTGKFRYDIYADKVFFLVKGIAYSIENPDDILKLKLENLAFIYSEYLQNANDDKNEKGYFIEENEGGIKLLTRKHIRIQDAEPPKLYQEAKPAKFVITADTYYLKTADAPAVKIDNKKDLETMLSSSGKAVSDFIRKNKINIKKKADLLKVIEFSME